MNRYQANVLSAMLMVGICAVSVAQDTKPAAPRLELSIPEWNFGEVWQGQPLNCLVKITNTGDAPLTIKVTSSCGCTIPTQPKSPLDPGASDTMKISYDGAHRRGAAHQTLSIATNDPNRAVVGFDVRGNVKPIYDVSPVDNLNFARLYQDSQESRATEIANKYTQKMSLRLKEGLETPGFAVELKELEPGMRYELTARTQPPLPAGVVRHDLVLETGLELLPEIHVLIAGTVYPPIAVYPDRLTWPRNLVSPIEKVLRVSYEPAHPVRIMEVRATNPAITVTIRDVPSSSPTAPDSERPQTQPAPEPPLQEVIVQLPPGAPLSDDSPITIELRTDSRDPAYERIAIPVQIVGPGTGTAAPRAESATRRTPTAVPVPSTP